MPSWTQARAENRAGTGTPGRRVRQAERFWAVTADRPFVRKPGLWGRLRGALLLPAKVILRKLMRWYVEPAFAQQRDFNASVLKALTSLNERVDTAVSSSEGGDKEAPE